MTIGGDILDYEGNTKVPTTELTTMKLLLKNMLRYPGCKFITIGIENVYLKTEMKEKQHMFIPLELIPETIMIHCNLHEKFIMEKYSRASAR